MKSDRKLMRRSIIMLAISSFSLLLITVSDYSGSTFNVIMAVLTGLLFWFFLISGYATLAVISKHRKVYESEHSTGRRRAKNKKRPGAFCFFSNPKAACADVAMIVLLVALAVIWFIPVKSIIPKLIIVPMFLFSVHMHCILNGVNYKYISQLPE